MKDRLDKLIRDNVKAEEEALLRYLLANDGWARLSVVSRKFGSLQGEGFYWEDEPPGSPLGVLWSIGLVGVGKAHLEKRREKIVAIPVELRQPLSEILASEGFKWPKN